MNTVKFIDARTEFPASNTVTYCGHVLQTELTGIPKGETKAVPGGAAAEMREILRQLDETLATLGIDKGDVVSFKLYLQDLKRDFDVVTRAYEEYFGSHTPLHGVYGVELQPGILVEVSVVANVPVYE